MISYLTTPYYPYEVSKIEGGLYLKQVSHGNLPMDQSIIIVTYVLWIFILGVWMLLIVIPKNLYYVLLTNYIFPISYGWKMVYLFNSMSIFSQNVVCDDLRNLVSFLEMVLLGIPPKYFQRTILLLLTPHGIFLGHENVNLVELVNYNSHVVFYLPICW